MAFADELQKMHALKEHAEAIGRTKTKADSAFKEQQAICLEMFESEKSEGFRTGGRLFTPFPDRIKGLLQDRRQYIPWALDHEESIQEFIDEMARAADLYDHERVRGRLYDALNNLSGLKIREDQRVLNDLAKTALDDEVEMPPGVGHRPDPYIQDRAS